VHSDQGEDAGVLNSAILHYLCCWKWSQYNFTVGYNKIILIPLLFAVPVIAKKGSPYSITERRVPELIPVLCSQPAGDVSHKPGGKLPLLSARPAVTSSSLKKAATNFAAR